MTDAMFEDVPGPGFNSRYEPHEDTDIKRMLANGRSRSDIATALGRSQKSIDRRIDALRREGVLLTYSPRRRALEVTANVTIDPPITLRLDDDLVRAVRKLGGFPRAEVVGGRTFWLTHGNRQWQYGVAA